MNKLLLQWITNIIKFKKRFLYSFNNNLELQLETAIFISM